jgi:hypothetical protein
MAFDECELRNGGAVGRRRQADQLPTYCRRTDRIIWDWFDRSLSIQCVIDTGELQQNVDFAFAEGMAHWLGESLLGFLGAFSGATEALLGLVEDWIIAKGATYRRSS